MDIKQYFSPQVIKKFDSKINKEVELVQFGGRPRLDMGGLTQSGWIIESIWNSAFKKLLPKGFIPRSVLILGFGAGSAAKLIHRKWPEASITGVEIDPTVIKIAKEHFQIGKIPKLDIINADAVEFVSQLKKQNYDLTLVDCYLGDQVPKSLEDPKFFLNLKKHSQHILINRLFWGEFKQTTLKFLDQLDKYFSTKTARTPSNFLISVN